MSDIKSGQNCCIPLILLPSCWTRNGFLFGDQIFLPIVKERLGQAGESHRECSEHGVPSMPHTTHADAQIKHPKERVSVPSKASSQTPRQETHSERDLSR